MIALPNRPRTLKNCATWILFALACCCGGCAVNAYSVKTTTVEPSDRPVIVVSQCKATSTDYYFYHTATAELRQESK
jgi:hypothetical protein